MYRSIFLVALACVLALASAQRGCPTYCWYGDKIAKDKCTTAGYMTKECMRDGKKGDTCDCNRKIPGGPGGPGKTPAPPAPTSGPGPAVKPCGKIVVAPAPAPVAMSVAKTSVFVKKNRGFFNFDWAAYSIKDSFVIKQGGDKIFDSGYVMGMNTNRVFLNGKGKNVMIEVMAQKAGSIFDFVVGCAKI